MTAIAAGLRWLGIDRSRRHVGIRLTDEQLVVAVVRDRPLRVVAIARSPLPVAAIVHGDIRLPQRVIATMSRARSDLGLADPTPATIAVDPLSTSVQVAIGAESEAQVAVADSIFDRAAFAAGAAGFRVQRIDPSPVSVARLAVAEHGTTAAARTADGWTIVIDEDGLDATCRQPAITNGLELGEGIDTLGPAPGVIGTHIECRFRDRLDASYDAVAIGAALSGLGCTPLISAAPRPVSTSASAWTAQPVA